MGPQIRFMESAMVEKGKKLGIPVEVINSADYGTCNGKNVLKQALLLKKKGITQ